MNLNFWAENFKRLIIALLLFVLVVIIGTFGYYFISDNYSLIDSFYMTIITITTVGFKEVHELDNNGKIFTVLLLLSSLGILGYLVTTFTSYILEGIFKKSFKNYKVNQKISKLRKHVIICGYGRNGQQAAIELTDHKQAFVVIEKMEETIEKIREKTSSLYVQGDATDDAVLSAAGILKAKALIATMPKDADNMFIVLSARRLNPKLKIISRCSDARSEVKLRHAGADNVIMPDLIGGQKMAKLVAQPDIIEFLDYILLQSSKDVSLEEISCAKMNKRFVNQTIQEIGIRDKTGANIVGLRTADGQYVFNPPPTTQLHCENQIFILGNPEQISSLRKILKEGI